MTPQPALSSLNHATFARPTPKRTVTPRILRPPALSLRRRSLDLRALLSPVIARSPQRDPGRCVLTAASFVLHQNGLSVPPNWFRKLAASFGLHAHDGDDCAPDFEVLPKAAWNDPSFLGEVLAASRALKPLPERQGRAGRVSAGCIYTPASVARCIVTEVHVGARRVIDPACGAGVFLLEAFERAYRRRLEGGASPIQAARAALSHEICGIDIDAQALAVAEFSLRLLALRLAGLDRDVPLDLRLASALDPHPDLDGHCECVVGNPPFIEGRGLAPAELAKLRRTFACAAVGKVNLFAVFVERSLALLRDGGVMALVLPATFQRNARYRPLRQLLLQHTLESIKPLDPATFGSRVVETVVLRVRKKPPQKDTRVQLSDGLTLQSRLPMGPVLRFCDHLPRSLRRQIELMERHGVPLSDCFEVRDGISTGFQPFPQKLLGERKGSRFVSLDGHARPFNPALHRRIIDGCEFNSFTPVQWAGRYIEYDKRHEHTPLHPGRPFNCQLRDLSLYDRAEKILTRQTARGLIATVDRERFLVRNSVHITFAKSNLPIGDLSLDALCACMNSRFYTDYMLAMSGENGAVFPQVHVSDIRCLPILPGLLRPGGALAQFGADLLAAVASSALPDDIAALKTSVVHLLHDAFGLH